ncbi:hypothetical protein [uncultured Parasphingorhabdus sp.]|uniref:hypothetical protein n=1 Tax=uncultured Parasphingorhabdus sp. TaxID=2709694 RepID=UPI0030DD40F8|tara:strand:+ start:15868 stop:16143 length:276 start_codon:yes stop_codon:yes gene_type:complete
MNRIEVFQDALQAVNSLNIPSSYDNHKSTLIEQLNFLIQFEEGEVSDLGLLKSVNIGIIAVRIIEDFDLNVANKIYSSSAQWERMKEEKGV